MRLHRVEGAHAGAPAQRRPDSRCRDGVQPGDVATLLVERDHDVASSGPTELVGEAADGGAVSEVRAEEHDATEAVGQRVEQPRRRRGPDEAEQQAGAGQAASTTASAAPPNFGTNVYIFDPSMSQSTMQATLDTIANQQVDNETGTQRYALLFKPGTYGTVANPLIFQVGYYTQVAGLGVSPADVTINGHVDVYNRCLSADNCLALVNFWRSLSNLTIKCDGSDRLPDRDRILGRVAGCTHTESADQWSVLSHGLLQRRSAICERRIHRRFAVRRRHRGQRFSAAVSGQE